MFNNYCCNTKGYCGTSNEFCSIDKGCQNKFGKCTNEGNTCNNVKKELSITNENESSFTCKENDDGFVQTL